MVNSLGIDPHPAGMEACWWRSGDWIRQAHNLCITGPTGCGKTWLACALGNQACRQGLSVRYLRLPALFEHLRIAHGDGSWPRLMNRLLKMDVAELPALGFPFLFHEKGHRGKGCNHTDGRHCSGIPVKNDPRPSTCFAR